MFFIPSYFSDVLYVTPLDAKTDITSSHLLKGHRGELFEVVVVEELLIH